MKLILKQSVEHLGEVGEVVDVKAGYGRNYLVPHGLAYLASESNIKRLEEERVMAEERSRRDFLEASRRASQLEGLSLTFRERAGDDGKLFGSVSIGDIVDRVNSGALDFEFEKRTVQLEEPLKALGVIQVALRLHPEVELEIEVTVEREEG